MTLISFCVTLKQADTCKKLFMSTSTQYLFRFTFNVTRCKKKKIIAIIYIHKNGSIFPLVIASRVNGWTDLGREYDAVRIEQVLKVQAHSNQSTLFSTEHTVHSGLSGRISRLRGRYTHICCLSLTSA